MTGCRLSSPARDAGTHGTHVSSLIAGARAGIAKGADLAVAAVLTFRNAEGRMSGGLIQIVNGLNWLVVTPFRADVPGVDLVNASLGGSGFRPYLLQGVRNARRIGIPFIASIGNAGRDGPDRHSLPGNYPELFAVGASDRNDTVADFSAWAMGRFRRAPTIRCRTCPLPVSMYGAQLQGAGSWP